MTFPVDIWVRGTNHATTEMLSPVTREPQAWTEADVHAVLAAMLRALERAKDPGADGERPIAMRGFSWIVNPYQEGGVVIALELTLGAVVAGPFDIAEGDLTAIVTRVMTAGRVPAAAEKSETVH